MGEEERSRLSESPPRRREVGAQVVGDVVVDGHDPVLPPLAPADMEQRASLAVLAQVADVEPDRLRRAQPGVECRRQEGAVARRDGRGQERAFRHRL